MGTFQAHIRSLRRAFAGATTARPLNHTVPSLDGSLERTPMRRDPQALGASRLPADPYTTWLQLREADLERERQPVRWIYRHRTLAGPSIRAHALPERDRREYLISDKRAEGKRLTAV
jgi:hypothetical protein